MNKYFMLFVVGFQIASSASFASDTTCQKEFGLDVAYCANTELQDLSPKLRAEWQKTCVANAKLDKAACETGSGNTCQEDCQDAYDSQVLVCQSIYNPLISGCGTDIVCKDIYQTQLSSCIDGVTNTFNSCISTCPL